MSRRTSRKSNIVQSYAEVEDETSLPATVKRTPTKRKLVDAQINGDQNESIQSDSKDSPSKLETNKNLAKSKAKSEHLKTVTTELEEVKATAASLKKRKVETDQDDHGDTADKKEKKKRKTKEEKEEEAMPLAPRTAVSSLKKAMYIGAHVSGAGGVQNSINNALHIGGNSFALFLKSQRKWTNPPLAADARDQFRAFCGEHKYDAAKHVLPHGSYLVNLAQPEPEKAELAYSTFLDDLQRCEALGIKLYNFHPGNTGPHPRPDAIARIAANLNKAHKSTKTVVTVLENMAGSGNVVGSTFEDLRDIIALIEDKSRVGVCIDTCHSFAAGYDLRSPDAFKKTMDLFSSIVGNQYLRALHLNDSKTPLSSHRDLHANIGTGFLGLRAFHNIVNYEPFQDLPMVLETPIDRKGPDGKVVEDKSIWAAEIKLLEGLVGADAESEHFKSEKQRLQDIGADERKKFQGKADKKAQKTIDSMFKAKSKSTKKAAEESEGKAMMDIIIERNSKFIMKFP